jgi:hypothetical protein
MEHERGQAGVETLIALPVLMLVALVGAQAVVWALGALLAGSAASAGARALARGDPAIPAARAELPAPLRRFTDVVGSPGVVRVVVRVPSLVPWLPTFEVSASARP